MAAAPDAAAADVVGIPVGGTSVSHACGCSMVSFGRAE